MHEGGIGFRMRSSFRQEEAGLRAAPSGLSAFFDLISVIYGRSSFITLFETWCSSCRVVLMI